MWWCGVLWRQREEECQDKARERSGAAIVEWEATSQGGNRRLRSSRRLTDTQRRILGSGRDERRGEGSAIGMGGEERRAARTEAKRNLRRVEAHALDAEAAFPLEAVEELAARQVIEHNVQLTLRLEGCSKEQQRERGGIAAQSQGQRGTHRRRGGAPKYMRVRNGCLICFRMCVSVFVCATWLRRITASFLRTFIA